MTVLFVLPEHDIFIFDWTDLATGVGPYLSTAHIESDNEQSQGHLGPHIQGVEGAVQGPDEAEDHHEELEQRH